MDDHNNKSPPTVVVPRWTPSPSPTRSLLKDNNLSNNNNNPTTTTTSTSSTVLELQLADDHEIIKQTNPNPMAMASQFPFSIGFGINHETTPSLGHFGDSYNNKENSSESDKVAVVLGKGNISLTWEELGVRVSDGESNGPKMILQHITGYARPGQILAIMGPSGSGKSTLLDALAGRLNSQTKQTGEILINGRKETLAYGTSAYVTQDDSLMTTLTVREAVYYSAQLQLPNSMSTSEKRERAETTIREMGLQGSVDTRIGGWSVKGLSGGQMRRVSICIEILTQPKLLFLDEPTSGLDSAASFHVMSRIVKLARRDERTVIASIHQPSSEVFELFHNLCLLSSGRTVYFGPVLAAEEFFTSNGFPCPSLRNPSDHYLRTINKDFDVDLEQGCSSNTRTEKAIDTLVESYKSSETFKQVKQQVSEIRQKARGSMLMFVAAFLTFMAIGGFPSFVEDMKIFGRERLNGHYGVASFVMGNTFSSIPYLVLISVIPGAIAYYLVGLQKSIEHFAYFSIMLFVCMMLVESLMMIVASIVPDFLMGIITGAGIQGVMMLNGGFFRLPNDIPKPFWRYPMYYIAFHKYANQGFYKNEFQGLTFPNGQAGGELSTISGEEVLKSVWQVELSYSKWVDVGILIGMVVIYRLLFLTIIKTKEMIKSH
ncbi:hypothetical protein F8388_020086 [Cannabis sativa]|uniref:ABC transporter domain-containing protein n=1 Tax=Cannabis sativa TaxID=3483 RepID=A0A7J6F7Q5_CANSA|nr:hypothetical protein F8388_020086 [Cannabis sativa]KAF4402244.1 hypothetical protein G4B88_017756 [Cannabis sativa]